VVLAAGNAVVFAAGKAMAEPWSFSASAFTYFVPEDQDYLQPTLTADRGSLHLEARYNYEDFHIASAWVGWNFNVRGTVTFAFTPILGGVFGDTNGIAPGYEGTLSWKSLELYSESEHVIDTDDSSDSFFYTWSELSVALSDWCRLGSVIQRTKAYESDRELQRGFLAGLSYGKADMSAYVFNPDDDRPIVVVAVDVGF
jgi:hypothetical protein